MSLTDLDDSRALLPASSTNSPMWEPRYFLHRDVSATLHEVTRRKTAIFFDELLRLANLEDAQVNYETAYAGIRIDALSALGRDVIEELRSIFDGNQDGRITREELMQGLKKLVLNWLGRSSRVQERANDFLIVTLNEMATRLYGFPMENEDIIIRSVNHLIVEPFSIVSPHSAVAIDNPTPTTVNTQMQSGLFRSASCADGDDGILEMSQITRDVMNEFVTNIFPNNSEYIDFRALPWDRQSDYRELFDYFDNDDDGIIWKRNVRDGMHNLGANFISCDAMTQSLANQYIQRKLDRAIAVLYRSSPRRLLTLPVNSSAHYRDYHGNEHLCTIRAYEQRENKYVVHLDIQRSRPLVLLVHASELNLIVPTPTPPPSPRPIDDPQPCVPVAQVETPSERVENETNLLEALARFNPSSPRIEPHQPEGLNSTDRGYYITLGVTFDWENISNGNSLIAQDEARHQHRGRGYRSRLSFDRADYGVRFTPFLDSAFISSEDRLLVDRCRSANETFRCFFIHLGVAISMHPYMLMLKMRQNCRDIQAADDDYSNALKVFYGPPLDECIRPSSFIDASVLCAYWPPEMNGFRLLIITFATSNDSLSGFESISTYTPINSPQYDPVTNAWLGEDIILKLQDGHFNILKPSFELDNDDDRDNPSYMRWDRNMKPIDFITSLFKFHNDNSPTTINIYEFSVPPNIL